METFLRFSLMSAEGGHKKKKLLFQISEQTDITHPSINSESGKAAY